MYVLASKLINLPIISLQTGETLASVVRPIITYEHLRLVGFTVDSGRSTRTLLTMTSVRQLALDCVIIDTDAELSEPDDIIRFKTPLEDNYTPLGKPVQTESTYRLGTVEDYTVNIETELIQKLYIRPPILKAWFSSSLIIDRTQVVDIQPKRIIVRDTTERLRALGADVSKAEAS
jgi:sporulation protein YlmC with PRC-barrel domain